VSSAYETEIFAPVIEMLTENAKNDFAEAMISKRIIADHTRAAIILMGDKYGIEPSNTDQGYVLRKLIRRAYRHLRKLEIDDSVMIKVAEFFIDSYKDHYTEIAERADVIRNAMSQEIEQFAKTLKTGEKEFAKIISELPAGSKIDGKECFKLYDTYGFPLEMTVELAKEHGFTADEAGFEEAFKAHQELSRAGAEQKFKGGLADHSEKTTKLHTATHLLHQALRNILGDHVEQKGSNITQERLRFDFNHDDKVNPEQLAQVEEMVNYQIQRNLHVTHDVMTVNEAKENGAIGLFEDRYGDQIKVYRIGDFSLEICGGPHVAATGEMGTFKIKKEESCGKGIRRIKAVLI